MKEELHKIDLDTLDARKFIVIKEARTNNLKNISLAIPRNKLVVITGLSGSGKSSLAIDTIFAEGQRMYVESLSAYVRQFLGKIEKPLVTQIRGLSPAIAIEQKQDTSNPRSTIGTITEIYEYLKLLYAKIGVTYSPISNTKVTKDNVSDVVNYIYTCEDGNKIMILYPLKVSGKNTKETLKIELGKGFTRIMHQDNLLFIEDIIDNETTLPSYEDIYVLVDRIALDKNNLDFKNRVRDSVQTAFFEGLGHCLVRLNENVKKVFSDKFELDGLKFELPSVNFLNFNSSYGACSTCEGLGIIIGVDKSKVIPNKKLSVFQGTIAPWQTDYTNKWHQDFISKSNKIFFPIHKSYCDLSAEEESLIWNGNKSINGLNDFFGTLRANPNKMHNRMILSRYVGKIICHDCIGTRIRKEASYVKISDKSIQELLLMSIDDLILFFVSLQLDDHTKSIANRLLIEINCRLRYLGEVGVGYLTLNRQTSTLSGGELQRIKLATSLGSTLVGALYILDEPTIGLHPKDTARLIDILKSLKQKGNTVIIVEHDEEVMCAADQIIDIGPNSGSNGGEIVFQGNWQEIKNFGSGHTARYLNGLDQIPVPKFRKAWFKSISIKGARENNLKNIDVVIPVNALTVVTGVSGSGKSTLVKKIIYPAICSILNIKTDEIGNFDSITGNVNEIENVEFISQDSIGKSSRSNPASYIGAYDIIRALFAKEELSKNRNYTQSHFSFNTDGGRCESCLGEGKITVAMQFMADIKMQCEACDGKRFKPDILDVKYRGKNIYEVLDTTVEDSIHFFAGESILVQKFKMFINVGLGYIKLGQSTNSMSGGECQRLKLACFLDPSNKFKNILFIFDEPTTGLHMHDVHKLMEAIQNIIKGGHTVIIIEHNMHVVKCADWIIDLGSEGSGNGGELIFSGTPENMIAETKLGYTATYLKKCLQNCKS